MNTPMKQSTKLTVYSTPGLRFPKRSAVLHACRPGEELAAVGAHAGHELCRTLAQDAQGRSAG